MFEPGRVVRALGLMSGTSLDGVDAAVIETDGVAIRGFGPSLSQPYAPEDRAAIRAAFGWGPAEAVAALVDARHIQAVEALGASPELIGYHGQTVAHDPARGRTRQLGDGRILARRLGAPVVWDFRSADMAAGGQGAPLASFFHWACARHVGASRPVAFLNLGGVGNVTWVDPQAEAPEAEGALLAFDTGPGNALIDDFMAARAGRPFDEDGAAAASGRVSAEALARLLDAPYLAAPPPKSLDREDFAFALKLVEGLSVEDAAATLTMITAECVAQGVPALPSPPARWLVTGGGRRNPVLMRMLSERLGVAVEPVEAAGLDGDMLEAQAFGYLAVRAAQGLPLSAPGTTGCRTPVAGGRIAVRGD